MNSSSIRAYIGTEYSKHLRFGRRYADSTIRIELTEANFLEVEWVIRSHVKLSRSERKVIN